MRFSQQPDNPRRLRGWPIGRVLLACLAAGILSLGSLALASLHSSAPPVSSLGPSSSPGPASPPVRVCGNDSILRHGPPSPPRGAVIVPAGDDSRTVIAQGWTIRPDTTYWFAPGIHTLGTDPFAQIEPQDGDTFVGAPGAILDGQSKNRYAFAGRASNVIIKYLTVKAF